MHMREGRVALHEDCKVEIWIIDKIVAEDTEDLGCPCFNGCKSE